MQKIFVLMSILMSLLTAPAWSQVTAIKAGHIVMPASGNTLANKVILIEGERITAIVDHLPDAGVDTIIDLSDHWLLPGLIDVHSHLTAVARDGESLTEATLKKDTAYRALIGAQMGREMLTMGFTTVRDIGNAGNYADSALRKAIAEGRVPGPRVFNAGKIISVLGGQSHHIAFERGKFWNQEYLDVVSPDDMRRAIHQNVYYGATFIKLVVGDQPYSLSDETLKAAVEEAKRANMKVAMHAWGDAQVARAVIAGAASIEHGFGTSDETFQLMKKNGTYFVGTEFPARYLALYWNEQKAKDFTKKAVAQLHRAHKLGVPLAFGTDIIMVYKQETRGKMALNYLENWIAADIPPEAIIKAMTVNGADLIGVSQDLGSIEEGKIADIIAVSHNPLKNIDALKRVTFVMKAGERIR